MAIYSFTRELELGAYNINNRARVDGNGDVIHLWGEIETALPGKTSKMTCNGINVDITSVSDLSAGDQTTLATVVSDHKNNV
ncbi:hypothetical protein LCGC14_0452400 [marine sediment metagenome]|uniref:Uncharacterized protein n=1 Tax=marine sediment metagenome TaxID=412755 RepID=A0A0F9SN02_9ZZZZ